MADIGLEFPWRVRSELVAQAFVQLEVARDKKYLTINLGSGLSCSSALLASTMLSIAMFESEAARMEPLSLDCFDHALRSGQLDRKYDFRAVQRSALCGSRRELSNAYLLAKFGFDTAENEPCQVSSKSSYLSVWI